MIDTGLCGKVAVVTGGNNPHGIGAATARALAAQGASVLITSFRQTTEGPCFGEGGTGAATVPGESFYKAQQGKTADAIVEAIRVAEGRAAAMEADLGDAAVVPRIFDRAEAEFGPVDVLINNAAHCLPDTFVPTSERRTDERAVDGFPMSTFDAERHDRHFAVNARAPALLMAEFLRRRVESGLRGGRIVNVSTDGSACFPSEVSYGASKHALESYSRSAAAELGPFGITVNVVSLGPIQTGWITPEDEERWGASIPLRRMGRPDDVADMIVFLASEQARWITGQRIHVGGGHRM